MKLQKLISIWVIIETFKIDDVFRKPNNAVLAFRWCHMAYDVIVMSMSFQQVCHIIQQIKPPNKSFNLNREILCKLWLKSLKIGSTLL